jgi:hypothetical protein
LAISVEGNLENWKRQRRKHFDDENAVLGLPTIFRVFCGAQVPFETPNWRTFVEHARSRPVRRLDASTYETDQ